MIEINVFSSHWIYVNLIFGFCVHIGTQKDNNIRLRNVKSKKIVVLYLSIVSSYTWFIDKRTFSQSATKRTYYIWHCTIKNYKTKCGSVCWRAIHHSPDSAFKCHQSLVERLNAYIVKCTFSYSAANRTSMCTFQTHIFQ